MAMPVLFKEISTELGMDLVQIGLIGTVISLTGLVIGLFGGALGDRFGTRRTLIAACVLTGVTGALRTFSQNFATLMATTFLFGLVQPIISVNLSKTCAIWFPARERGTANGGISVGMALGFLLGSLLSATVLSPLLGGWRNVLVAFGALACLIGVLWFATRNLVMPGGALGGQAVSLRAGLSHVTKLRDLWIMGLAALGYGGCVNAVLAYLPLYLRNIGWIGSNADTTVATFHAVSLLGAIPLAMLSDRLQRRRIFLMLGALLLAAGIGSLTVAAGVFIVIAVVLAGFMRDGFMAVFMTTVMETPGVGLAYTGSAIGFTLIFFQMGGVFAPPLGNSLAAFGPALPFAFWGAMALLSFVSFWQLKTKRVVDFAGAESQAAP
jgi:predicted MFS family arabinose efflux permease